MMLALPAAVTLPFNGAHAASVNASVWLEQSFIALFGCGDDDQGTLKIRASGGFFYCGVPGSSVFACDKTKVRLVVSGGDAGDLEVLVNGSWTSLAGGVAIDIGGAGAIIPVRAKDGAAIDLGRVHAREEAAFQRTLTWGPEEERMRYQGIERFIMQVEKVSGGTHRKDFSIVGSKIIGPGINPGTYGVGVKIYVLNPNPKLMISATRSPRQTSRCTTTP